MRRTKVILSVIAICLSVGPTAEAGMVERAAALAELHQLELAVYVGNSGSIGMSGPSYLEQAAHPSILFRVLDAKRNNDNGLIGSTDVVIEQLGRLSMAIDGLMASDDDYQLLQQESADATGFTFTERMAILKAKLQMVEAALPASGINNEARYQIVMERTAEGIARLTALLAFFPTP